ncbi:MAG TPA: SNF2-related protein, partial [Gaiellaceae bacterium]|nr:SNF2-related protein [Gaiellaceae bacterium]
MSVRELTDSGPVPALPTLEVLWQPDASAFVIQRSPEGELSAGRLHVGMPSVADLAHLGRAVASRKVSVGELVRLAEAPPAGVELGGTARALFAVVELAQGAVTEGLVHPQLEYDQRQWFAFWAATLDDTIEKQLALIAAALPPVCAVAFDGDRDAVVQDLYPYLVDHIARARLRAAGVRLVQPLRRTRSAIELFLEGLTAPAPELPEHSGYSALERRLTQWVDDGLSTLSAAPWRLALHLDEREATEGLTLELWLQAADDETLSLPASALWSGGEEVFAFFRSSDPRRALVRTLADIEPLLAEGGIAFAETEPSETQLDPDAVRFFLREAMPTLEERDVPVLLPAEWLRSTAKLRVNLTARSRRDPSVRSSGLLATSELASFDWRLAIGDSELSEEELQELVTAKDPFVQVGGRWHAVRRADVEKALRFLEQRRTGSGIVELVRAVSGLETDEAGLELGEVSLDAALEDLLHGGDERHFRPLETPAGMAHALFPFQERGHGWLRMLGDLGIGGILADDMGLGKTVQAIAMLVSEREEHGREAFGPTLVVCPMSVARQWVAEVARFAPKLRVHLHHGHDRLEGAALVSAVQRCDVVVTSYDIVARDVDVLAEVAWDRLLCDEAQDVKNPSTK